MKKDPYDPNVDIVTEVTERVRTGTSTAGHVYANIRDSTQPETTNVGMQDVVIEDPSDDTMANETDYYNFSPDNLSVKVGNLFSYVTRDHVNSFEKEFKPRHKKVHSVFANSMDPDEHRLIRIFYWLQTLSARFLVTRLIFKLNLPNPSDLSKVCRFAKKPENIAMNRYNGIYPFDHSRVTIPGQPKFFINACYIDGYNRKKAYIASFGPTAKTTDTFWTFWRMVWHEKSNIIVMLTNLREPSGMKCEQYWPVVDAEEQYGHVSVKCRSVEVFAEYTIMILTLSKGKEQRSLTHLHYTAWPDKGVPSEVASLVEFRQRVKTIPEVSDGPVIVHCSAGVGRTRTYIALDILTEKGRAEESVDVFNCVSKLREQRVNMVQTATLKQEVDTETEEEQAVREENRTRHTDKSRRHSDIPGDRGRVRLYLRREAGDHDYINAVFINIIPMFPVLLVN